MKKALSLILFTILFGFTSHSQESVYDFEVESILGEEIDLNQYKGYKILIVNTASKCGLTPQYEKLEELYNEYKDRNFVIIGFPSNDFLKQEPGTNEEIAAFCQENYGVSFPMMAKVNVKGKDQCDLFNYLTVSERNGFSDEEVKWNFQKFLIDRDGKLVKVLSPKTDPKDNDILEWLNSDD